MKIKHPTSNIQHPTPNGVRRAGSLDVRCSNVNVECTQSGSVLIIVLWIAIGLDRIALYFANSMTYELRAKSDNRASALATEQAIEGAARYVSYILATYATNKARCRPRTCTSAQPCRSVTRDSGSSAATRPAHPSAEPYFALIDEGAKLNLNSANTNVLSYLPNMTTDFAQAIVDWRSTNSSGTYALDYAQMGYAEKEAPFETVDEELRLVYGATMELLAGDDLNGNGVLDANETNSTGSSGVNHGLLEYTTVYTREPNFQADGTTLTNVNTAGPGRFAIAF